MLEQNNFLEKALETAMSHEDMSVIIESNLERYKNENSWGFSEDEAKAMTALTLVFFMQHHGEENPYLMFKVLKDANYSFEGLYEPLNTITEDEYLNFLTGEFYVDGQEEVEQEGTSEQEETFAEEDSIAIWYNEEFTYMYVDSVLENGNLVCYSRKYGEVEIDLNVYAVRKVKDGSNEDIVAQAEYFYGDGEEIALYDKDVEKEILRFKPVKLGKKLHILNLRTNTVSEEGYNSLIHIMQVIMDNHEEIKVIEVI